LRIDTTLEYFRGHNITVCTKSTTNGGLDADGVRRLLSYSTPHIYQYGQPAIPKAITRVRMDKIKELLESDGVEETETTPVIVAGLAQLVSAKTYTDPEDDFFA